MLRQHGELDSGLEWSTILQKRAVHHGVSLCCKNDPPTIQRVVSLAPKYTTTLARRAPCHAPQSPPAPHRAIKATLVAWQRAVAAERGEGRGSNKSAQQAVANGDPGQKQCPPVGQCGLHH